MKSKLIKIELDRMTEEQKLSFFNDLYTIPTSHLSHGVVLKGSNAGDLPLRFQFDSLGSVIESFDLLPNFFAYCFHTTENPQEIHQLIKRYWTSIYPGEEPMDHHPKVYIESIHRFVCNLRSLHVALPGEYGKKEIKVYWNDLAENTLLPAFLEKEIDICDLILAVTPGEQSTSPHQSDTMDFSQQFQFVGFYQDGIGCLIRNCEKLSQEIYEENIFESKEFVEVADEILRKPFDANRLLFSAKVFEHFNIIKTKFEKMQSQVLKLQLTQDPEERKKYFRTLLTPEENVSKAINA